MNSIHKEFQAVAEEAETIRNRRSELTQGALIGAAAGAAATSIFQRNRGSAGTIASGVVGGMMTYNVSKTSDEEMADATENALTRKTMAVSVGAISFAVGFIVDRLFGSDSD